MTRIPPFRPDDWVKIKPIAHHPLSERVLQIRQIVGSLTAEDQQWVIWRVTFRHFPGEPLEWHSIERKATPLETLVANGRTRRAA